MADISKVKEGEIAELWQNLENSSGKPSMTVSRELPLIRQLVFAREFFIRIMAQYVVDEKVNKIRSLDLKLQPLKLL